jgi:hypothetical protein
MKNLFASAAKNYTRLPERKPSEFVLQSRAIRELNQPVMVHRSAWIETQETPKGKVLVRRSATYRKPALPAESEWSSRA